MAYDIDEKSGSVTAIPKWQQDVIQQVALSDYQRRQAEINKLEDLYPGEIPSLDEIVKSIEGAKFTTESYQAFIKVTLDDLQELIKRKQADYTNGKGPFANFEQASDFGVDPFKGVMLRMGDKFQRIKSFCSQGELQVKSEGVEDALLDVIGYSLIALAMLKEVKK